MNEREDIAMIPAQQLPQMRPARGVALVALGFAHRARGLERLRNLVVQFHTVRRDHECPVARDLAQHLLGEERDRVRLPRALSVPEDTNAIRM